MNLTKHLKGVVGIGVLAMSLILVISILIRLTAFAWSLVVLRRLRDKRVVFLSTLLSVFILCIHLCWPM